MWLAWWCTGTRVKLTALKGTKKNQVALSVTQYSRFAFSSVSVGVFPTNVPGWIVKRAAGPGVRRGCELTRAYGTHVWH